MSKRRASEIERNIELRHQYGRQDADKGYVHRARKGYPRKYLLDILRSPLPWPYARDVAAILLHVVRDVVRIEDNGRIEETEEDDESDVKNLVSRLPGVSSSANRFM